MLSLIPVVMEQSPTALDLSKLTEVITKTITPEQVLLLMGGVVSACAGYVLIYGFGRKLVFGFFSAVTRGKLKI